jgi:hypothetical protein
VTPFQTVCYLSIYQYGFLVVKDSIVGCQTINIICTFNIDKSKKKKPNKQTNKQNKTQITKTTPSKKNHNKKVIIVIIFTDMHTYTHI